MENMIEGQRGMSRIAAQRIANEASKLGLRTEIRKLTESSIVGGWDGWAIAFLNDPQELYIRAGNAQARLDREQAIALEDALDQLSEEEGP